MRFSIIESFTKVSRKFLEIIDQENDLLEINQLAEVSELLLQKKALATEYETQLTKLINAFHNTEIEEEEKADLIGLIEEIKEKLQLNERNLLVTLKSNEKFLEIIVRSAKKNGAPNCYYTKAGFFRRNTNTISMMSV